MVLASLAATKRRRADYHAGVNAGFFCSRHRFLKCGFQLIRLRDEMCADASSFCQTIYFFVQGEKRCQKSKPTERRPNGLKKQAPVDTRFQSLIIVTS